MECGATPNAAPLLFLGSQNCNARPSAPQEDPAVAELTRQADQWDKAIVRKDRAAIAANMAEDFRQIDNDGDLSDKEAFVKNIVSPKLEIAPYTVEDFDVRLYGNVALFSGRTSMKGRYDGRPFAGRYRYIDVYVRREGKWQIVSVQMTPLK